MTAISNILDPLSLPLYGERLIEASAGTGKTNTIVTLYLRFLLKLGNNAAFSRPLTVEELLVVTFTEAATNELRSRIRHAIHELRIACLRETTNNQLYTKLLDQIKDKKEASKWLLIAEQNMDHAAIFTIHSFCQRMLKLNVFESGMLFEQKIIEDEYTLQYQACADFWRRYCYQLPHEIAKLIYAKCKGPEELLKIVKLYIKGEMPIIKSPPSTTETLITRHQKNISLINNLKHKWCSLETTINTIIENSAIDRRKFNRNNQRKWIEKINAWAQKETHDYTIPKVLKKFTQSFLSKNTKPEGIIPEHPIFIEIEILLSQQLTLNDLLIIRAITEIRETVVREKKRRNELSFDDMVQYLNNALKNENGEKLAQTIRNCFPVGIVDEFQDTDEQQYSIFRRLWYQQHNTALLLIGDPKQSIYAFRGADIFTYIKARKEIQAHYTLSINWRSAPGMVESVNTLFQRLNNPFIFQEIPFVPIKSANKNYNKNFEYKGKIMPAMQLWLMTGKYCSVNSYQNYMAKHCALQIRNYLNASLHNKALLWSEKKSNNLKASDITILVRNSQEATLIRNALKLLNIPSVYYSNNNSVFETLDAQEILWLLQAVLSPEQENVFRYALSSSLFGFNAHDIDNINNNINSWNMIIEEFNNYRERWQKYGIMAMLREIIIRRYIPKNMLATINGERYLTNILHIGELLQEEDSKLENKHTLIRWLEQNIAKPNNNITNQLIRLESDKHLVRITTIHKSKGLEYPIVWLPFIANYRIQRQAFYYDLTSFEKILDLNKSSKSLELSETERLAEDLRLLYVALTRSIWHCNLGIAPICFNPRKKREESDFHRSALGYLIQKGKPRSATGLYKCLQSLCSSNIALCISDDDNNTPWQPPEPKTLNLQARHIQRAMVSDWRVTSYSALHQQEKKETLDLISNKPSINISEYNLITRELNLTPHQFPRGTKSGMFLHSLFETLDFTQPISDKWVLEMLQKNGYETHWQPVITKWITTVLHAQLTEDSITLHQLDSKNKYVEMEFYLPIEKVITTEELDLIIRSYDSIPKEHTSTNVHQIHGMLKGFIDLVFLYNGRYYQLDYKSNWLGDNNKAYTSESMLHAMRTHRYDLQYHLYTLALHRYLRQRIVEYNYETHFGCVIYLFLRGINTCNPQSGIFTARPDIVLIDNLDKLFTST